jgi:hypothetical protein
LISPLDEPVVNAVQRVSEARGATMAQVALAGVLKNPVVSAPIVGATRPHRLPEAIQRSTCASPTTRSNRASGPTHATGRLDSDELTPRQRYRNDYGSTIAVTILDRIGITCGIVAEASLDADLSASGEHGYMHIEVILDCVDLDCTAAFWQAALGYDREDTVEGRFVSLTGKGPSLSLQRVPEPKTVKNRMHLDPLVHDIEAEVARLHALGATSVTTGPRKEFGQHWFVRPTQKATSSAWPGAPAHDP